MTSPADLDGAPRAHHAPRHRRRRWIASLALLGALIGVSMPAAGPAEAALPYVSVPSHYRDYGTPKTLHDYCSWSPDSFGTYIAAGPGQYRSVSFKGPCARHDLCYENHGRSYKETCDLRFRRHLRINCRYGARGSSVFLSRCYDTAETYYWFVKRYGDG